LIIEILKEITVLLIYPKTNNMLLFIVWFINVMYLYENMLVYYIISR